MSDSSDIENKIIAKNRKARFNYSIEEVFEAGIVLKGSEVKSVRAGHVNITDAHAEEKNDEVWLHGLHIAEYNWANQFNHHPTRPRKLLLHKKEIAKLFGKLKVKGYTLVPLSLYFNKKNMIKVELGLAKGKKAHDKREATKERDWKRDQSRALKGRAID